MTPKGDQKVEAPVAATDNIPESNDKKVEQNASKDQTAKPTN